MPAIPKPYVLVQFAFKAYEDSKNERLTLSSDTINFTSPETDISNFATNFVSSAAIGQ